MINRIDKKHSVLFFALITIFIAVFLPSVIPCGRAIVKAQAADCFVVRAGGRAYSFSLQETTLTPDGYELNAIDGVIEKIYLDTLILPTDATLSFRPQSAHPFVISGERNGRAIDKARLRGEIQFALAVGKSEVTATFNDLKPKVSKNYLQKETAVRATFTTYYGGSSDERKNNIALACKSLNGAIIDSGASFSFNERVGKRSKENGYSDARVISDGKFTSGTGGGVCQVSTTLYNAALRAGLKITEYHRHSLAVSYVPPSFDAMVSDAGSDLVFLNDSGRRLYLQAAADGEYIKVTVYGIESEYAYDFRSEITEVIEAKNRGVEASSGEQPIAPKNGLKSNAFVSVYKNGALVSSYLFRSDVYAPIDGVYIIGE